MPAELPGSGERSGAAEPSMTGARETTGAQAGPEPSDAADRAEPPVPPGQVGPGDPAGPMNPAAGPGAGGPEGPAGEADEIGQAIITGAAYGVLFVLGVFLGVVGAFEHSWYFPGGFPIVAIGWLGVLFAVPYWMGRLMGTRLAALMTAAGWGVVSAVLTVQRAEGDLLIAATVPGYTYLYGGMVAVAIAVLLVPSNGSWLLTPRFGAPPPSGGAAEPPR